jgi:hypothetical protein
MKRLLEFFQDGTGMFSSMRLVFLTWGIGAFLIWGAISIINKSVATIPITIVEIMALCVVGKVAQSVTEK